MPLFAYKARDAGGELKQGVLEGGDSTQIADQLFNAGMTPIQIAVTQAVFTVSTVAWLKSLRRRRIKPMDVQLFSRQMYTLLKVGVPVMRGMSGLQDSAVNPSFGLVIQDLRESLDAGRDLSSSMRQHPSVFSPFYVSMVRVGELTGRIDHIFLMMFDYLEFDRDMRSRVKAAVRYPLFVVAALVVAMLVINIFVIPAFAKVYSGLHASLPLMTRVLIASSEYTVHYWPVLLGVIVLMTVGFRMYVKTSAGRYWWDRNKLRMPIAGVILHKATLARFARSFALAVKSGVPISQALSVISQTVSNAYIAQRIDWMREGVERGESIMRTAMATEVFTPVVLQIVAVGEETGELDDLMDEIAAMYEREVDYALKTLSSQIEPILILMLGILVLIMALGIFLPIWDLGQASLGGGRGG